MAEGIAVQQSMKLIGVHLASLSFIQAKDGVQSIEIGQVPESPGHIMVKVTSEEVEGNANRFFMCSPLALVQEYAETSGLVVPDTETVQKIQTEKR